MKRTLFIAVGVLLSIYSYADTLSAREWLTVSRPLDVPVFSDSADLGSLLDADRLDFAALRPREGEFGPGAPSSSDLWVRVSGDAAWKSPRGPARWRLGYAAAYVISPRHENATVSAQGRCAFAVFLEGKEISRATSAQDGIFRLESAASLQHGKSLLLVKAVFPPGDAAAERLTLTITGDPAAVGALRITTDARHSLARFEDLTLFDDVSSPVISPDGKYAAYLRSHYKPDHTKESWLEVMDIERRVVIHVLRPVKGIGHLTFASVPENVLIYTTSDDKHSIIWRMYVPQCAPEVVVRDVEGLVKIAFGGGNTPRLYFTADKKADDEEKDYVLFDELEDRLSDWTRSRELFAVPLEGGVITRITTAGDSFALDEFAPSVESGRLLFTRSLPKLARPYYDTEFYLLDTDKAELRKITSLPIAFETRPLSFTWLPGAREIAFVAAAHFTDPADTVYPSYTQTALYLLNVETGNLRNLTPGSRFSIEEDEDHGAVRYNASDGTLWFRAVRGAHIDLMRMDVQGDAVAEIVHTPQPVALDFDVSTNGRCAYIASGPAHPNALYLREGNRILDLLDPNSELVGKVDMAGFAPWNFVNSAGDTIDGWLYFPPNFAAAAPRTWPLVVYFYGGASPRDLRFTYSYHWWVANGYVVYVLNPRGCVGYGETFAAEHNNDWGTLASQDIIEGTQKLLTACPSLDPQRVGAYGGSYGGFIALDLATKTDLFAALCSQSGISNIGSYFGAGEWGFTYGDLALPGSYPWNRRDVFVDKSPVFHADQVRTPLLLMHGSDDTNVPAGESEQMFTALKLLGKNVAYVRFRNEDHIFSKFSNRTTEREILREWFDRYLKNDPTDWNARWKK